MCGVKSYVWEQSAARLFHVSPLQAVFEHDTMIRQVDDVMALCCKLSESRQIKAAVRNSAKGAAAAAGGAFVGGLLGGPPGLFIGTYACVF